MEGRLENLKPEFLYPAAAAAFEPRFIQQQPRLLQPRSIELREINPDFLVQEEDKDMDPFFQVVQPLKPLFFDNLKSEQVKQCRLNICFLV